MRARQATIVVGAPPELAALIHDAALKLDAVQTLIVAWADDILAAGHANELELILAEVPKEAARIMVAGRMTPEVEGLIERYMRRARRIGEPAVEGVTPLAIRWLSTAPETRPAALRRLLDELDPASATVVVRTDDSERTMELTLRALGLRRWRHRGPHSRGPVEEHAELVVLYDLPSSRRRDRRRSPRRPRACGGARAAAQLAALRELAGGTVTPLKLRGILARAKRADEAVRAHAARAAGVLGLATRELLALEPLLDDYDGVEIAAAALRLWRSSGRSHASKRRPRPRRARGARPPARH